MQHDLNHFTFGDRLRYFMETKGVSPKELASRCDIPLRVIQHNLHDEERDCSYGFYISIGVGLGLTADELYELSGLDRSTLSEHGNGHHALLQKIIDMPYPKTVSECNEMLTAAGYEKLTHNYISIPFHPRKGENKIMTKYEDISLPFHPGDKFFYVYDDLDGRLAIDECHITGVFLSEDGSIQFVIDDSVEDFGPKYQNFRTREEAEEFIEKLKASYPRHIEMNCYNSEKWFSPKYYLPEKTMNSVLSLNFSDEEIDADSKTEKSLHALFVREGDCSLPEGFYVVSPVGYDDKFDIDVAVLNEENTRNIPMDRIVGWMSFPEPAHSVCDNPPMDLPKE